MPFSNIFTIPNVLSTARLVSAPFLAHRLPHCSPQKAMCAISVFGVTDWLDGYLARKLHQKSILGSYLDPLADKVFVGSLTFALAARKMLPTPLACIIIGRDALLAGGSIVMGISNPEKGRKSVKPSQLSKWNTACQIGLLASIVGERWMTKAFPTTTPFVKRGLIVGKFIVTATTLSSGLHYVWSAWQELNKQQTAQPPVQCSQEGMEKREGMP
uniref:Cardiolipin synthase n=1 Tax=Stygiella incarcerata TaxID=1712417 RepID=A0A192ZIT5_9EUKA|nr:cardiolipin synthase [Stygiella incarcerata]